MVRSVSQGVLSEARDKNNYIMINDYVLWYILRHKLSKMSLHKKFMCGCEACMYANIIRAYLIDCRKKYLKESDPDFSVRPRLSSVDNFGTRYSQYIGEVIPYKILNKRSIH